MTSFSIHDIVVARKVHEDERSFQVNIVKDEEEPLILEGAEEFFMMLFVKMEDGVPTFWKPWDD